MNKERLLQLATHLKSGVLGHKVFDFNVINCSHNDRGLVSALMPVSGVCGTNGCAIGEMPIVFPEHAFFGDMSVSGKNDDGDLIHDFEFAEHFFDITEEESSFLFLGRDCDCESDQTCMHCEECNRLSRHASKEEVAARIEAFCVTEKMYI